MSNDEKRIILKDEGSPVHIITFFDKYGVVIIIAIIFGIFVELKTNGFGWGIILTIPVLLTLMLCTMGLSKKEVGESMTFKCVHCNKELIARFPSQRMTCIYCNKDIGYFDGKVYKITEENKECFQTAEEIAADLLKKQNSTSNNKSNLEQLKELKELLDMNAITQDEYEKKKNELLK